MLGSIDYGLNEWAQKITRIASNGLPFEEQWELGRFMADGNIHLDATCTAHGTELPGFLKSTSAGSKTIHNGAAETNMEIKYPSGDV